MTKAILFILAVLPTLLLGQETKKVTEENENPKFKEVYYVLRSDKSTRHGSYQKLGYKDAVLINGFYKNGVKDSVWNEYQWGGKTKKSTGTYSGGKKVGVWEYFDHKGDPEQKYDHSKNEMVFFKFDAIDKDKEFKVIKGADTIKTKLERPPLYIGGSSIMFEVVIATIKFPEQARDSGISGKTFIAFTIDSNGKTNSHRVIKGFDHGCDEEALRVVKLIPDNWAPAMLGGEAVNIEFILPINFKMN